MSYCETLYSCPLLSSLEMIYLDIAAMVCELMYDIRLLLSDKCFSCTSTERDDGNEVILFLSAFKVERFLSALKR